MWVMIIFLYMLLWLIGVLIIRQGSRQIQRNGEMQGFPFIFSETEAALNISHLRIHFPLLL